MKSSTRRNRRSFRPSGIAALEERCMLSNVTGFTVKDLGLVSDVGGLNNLGQVVGTLRNNHAFVTDANGETIHDLGAPVNGQSSGKAVNDRGQVVGQFGNQAFYTDQNGVGLHNINDQATIGIDINDNGQIIGYSQGLLFFYDTKSKGYHTLSVPGESGVVGYSINSSGQVSGVDYSTYTHAFLTDPNGGLKHNIGSEYSASFAFDVNNNSIVVGRAYSNSTGDVGFVSDPNGSKLHILNDDSGEIYGDGLFINNKGDIVGEKRYNTNGMPYHGFYYDGTIHDLNSMVPPGFNIQYVRGINDYDQIAALGLDSSGKSHALLLTPVKATPTITWANPADIVYGTTLSSTQLNASASVAGTFTYTLATPDVATGLVTHAGTDRPAAGVALNAGASQIITETFVPDDLINYTTVTTTASINVQKAPLRIVVDDQVACVGHPIPALTMSVTGLVNGDANEFIPFIEGIPGEQDLVGEHTIHFTTPAISTVNLDNYSASFVDGKLTVYNPVHLFNEAYYLNRYPDVAAAVKNGWIVSGYAHFIKFGVMSGYVGTTEWLPAIEKDYLSKNPNVAAYVAAHKGTASGYADFIQFGKSESRNGIPVTVPQSVVHLFDEATYLVRYPNVAIAVRNGWIASGYAHFIQFGLDAGYNGSPDWTPAIETEYLTANPDVAIAVQNHWIVSGYAHFVKYHSLGVRPGSPLIL